MAIRPAGSGIRPDPNGSVFEDKKRATVAGSGFFLKNTRRVRVGSGYVVTEPEPEPIALIIIFFNF